MASSLLLAGFDVLDPDSPVRLGTVGGQSLTDLGSPQTITTNVERMLTDGEIVSGETTGNRTLTLPLVIAGDPITRAGYATQLARTILDPAGHSVTWTPDGGKPVVFDCFRGQLDRQQNLLMESQGVGTYLATIPALPWAHDPDPTILSPSVASTLIKSLSSLTGVTTSPAATVDTNTYAVGTGSARFPVTFTSGIRYFVASAEASWTQSAADYSGFASIIVRTLTNVSGLTGGASNASTSMSTLTLTSSGGSSTWTNGTTPIETSWGTLPFDITQPPVSITGTGVNKSAVTGVDIVVWAASTANTFWPQGGSQPYFWLNDVRGYPAGAGVMSNGSANYLLPNVAGAARAPVFMAISETTHGLSGFLVASTPDPPPNYNPILTAIGDTPVTSWTRSVLSLQRTAPDVGTYELVLFCSGISGQTITTTVTVTVPSGVIPARTYTRTYTPTDDDLAYPVTISGVTYYLVSVAAPTLPPAQFDARSAAATLQISVSGFTGSNPVRGAWLVWSGGESVCVSGETVGFVSGFITPPSPAQQLGSVLVGSGYSGAGANYAPSNRTGQSVIHVHGGKDNHILVATLPPAGATLISPTPTVFFAFYPPWLGEAAA